MELRLGATVCHLSYEITQCCLSSEHTRPEPQPVKLVLNLPNLFVFIYCISFSHLATVFQ